MRIPLISIAAVLVSLMGRVVCGADTNPHEAIRLAVVSAVTERMPSASAVEVQVANVPLVPDTDVSATPAPGARLGRPIRFVITPRSSRSFTVIATVTVVAGHAVARRPVVRGAGLTRDDVEWREGPVENVLVEVLPALEDVLAGQARRAFAADEVVTRSMIAPALAVRAGDAVSVVVRSGLVEARGVGRAVSSGAVGEVIRVTHEGSRETRRARIVAPASVEVIP